MVEDAPAAAEAAHALGMKLIMGTDPIACALLKSPGECGADVAVGDGQSLGLPLSFGGPYLGFIACTQAMIRKLPGRLVGRTADHDGKVAYVLTLQAREQHIRREKASSNICSNQALCALTAGVYMASMGPQGLVEVAESCHSKAVYLAEKLSAIDGFELKHSGTFFNEFVCSCPGDADKLCDALAERGILAGLPVEGGILWCATEMNSKAQIDRLAETIKEVCA